MPASALKIHVYADGACQETMIKQARQGFIKGFTTNPSLMAQAGIRDYQAFARGVLKEIPSLPISFEVFSDSFEDMQKDALAIGTWGPNVYVKIPILNTEGKSNIALIQKLLKEGLKLNITAVCTQEQLDSLRLILKPEDDVIVSIFAGRIADTGVDPLPFVRRAVLDFCSLKRTQILWASCREVYNIYQADSCGCHIITVPEDILNKLSLAGKNLEQCSIEAVQAFYRDAKKAGFLLTHATP